MKHKLTLQINGPMHARLLEESEKRGISVSAVAKHCFENTLGNCYAGVRV